jgi:hypothetical protein
MGDLARFLSTGTSALLVNPLGPRDPAHPLPLRARFQAFPSAAISRFRHARRSIERRGHDPLVAARYADFEAAEARVMPFEEERAAQV